MAIVNEIITLSIMAFAVGMDAFSVGLGMGVRTKRLRQIFHIGLTVGIFHVLMPLLGILLGKILSEKFGLLATFSGGLLLILIGIQMLFASFKKEESKSFKPVGIGLFLFALSVSVDSFSIGLTLGIFGARTLTAILLFGIFATGLTWTGLLLGKRMRRMMGNYSEALGGAILFFFGVKLLFPI